MLPPLTLSETGVESTLTVTLTSRQDIGDLWSGPAGPPVWKTTFPDGCRVRIERGVARDYLFVYGPRAVFHLGPGASMLRCAPEDPEDPNWQRFLLDTVLHCTALLQGRHALHGGAIELADGGVAAFVAPSGGGKTTLAAELIRRGGLLCADDIVVLERHGEQILAHPSPPMMNMPLAVDAAEFADPIASFPEEQEQWVSVRRASSEAKPLAAIFVLERSHGAQLALEPLQPTPLHLLGHSLGFSHVANAADRLALFGDVVERVQVFRISADVTTAPSALADKVEDGIAAAMQSPPEVPA